MIGIDQMGPISRTLRLEEPVKVGRWLVVGYSMEYNEPVLDSGSAEFTLSQVRRAAWDDDREEFTGEQLAAIQDAVKFRVEDARMAGPTSGGTGYGG